MHTSVKVTASSSKNNHWKFGNICFSGLKTYQPTQAMWDTVKRWRTGDEMELRPRALHVAWREAGHHAPVLGRTGLGLGLGLGWHPGAAHEGS